MTRDEGLKYSQNRTQPSVDAQFYLEVQRAHDNAGANRKFVGESSLPPYIFVIEKAVNQEYESGRCETVVRHALYIRESKEIRLPTSDIAIH